MSRVLELSTASRWTSYKPVNVNSNIDIPMLQLIKPAAMMVIAGIISPG